MTDKPRTLRENNLTVRKTFNTHVSSVRVHVISFIRNYIFLVVATFVTFSVTVTVLCQLPLLAERCNLHCKLQLLS